MICLDIGIFVLFTIFMLFSGALLLISFYYFLRSISIYHTYKIRIFNAIQYKKHFDGLDGLPTKLIYKYLTRKEREVLLNFYERSFKNE